VIYITLCLNTGGGYVSGNRVVKQLGYSRRTMNNTINLLAAKLPLDCSRATFVTADDRLCVKRTNQRRSVFSHTPNRANVIVRLCLLVGLLVCISRLDITKSDCLREKEEQWDQWRIQDYKRDGERSSAAVRGSRRRRRYRV